MDVKRDFTEKSEKLSCFSDIFWVTLRTSWMTLVSCHIFSSSIVWHKATSLRLLVKCLKLEHRIISRQRITDSHCRQIGMNKSWLSWRQFSINHIHVFFIYNKPKNVQVLFSFIIEIIYYIKSDELIHYFDGCLLMKITESKLRLAGQVKESLVNKNINWFYI